MKRHVRFVRRTVAAQRPGGSQRQRTIVRLSTPALAPAAGTSCSASTTVGSLGAYRTIQRTLTLAA